MIKTWKFISKQIFQHMKRKWFPIRERRFVEICSFKIICFGKKKIPLLKWLIHKLKKNSINNVTFCKIFSTNMTLTHPHDTDNGAGVVRKIKRKKKKQKHHRRCSVRKGVLRNFAKFTGKHLFVPGTLLEWSCRPLLLKKRKMTFIRLKKILWN